MMDCLTLLYRYMYKNIVGPQYVCLSCELSRHLVPDACIGHRVAAAYPSRLRIKVSH